MHWEQKIEPDRRPIKTYHFFLAKKLQKFKGQVWVENDSIKYGDGIYFRKSIGRSIDVNKNGDSVGLHKRISLYGGA